MGDTFASIDAKMIAWLERQHTVVVAARSGDRTRPVCLVAQASEGVVEILGPCELALRLTASQRAGLESALQADPRICVMLAAFGAGPRVVRFHGAAECAGDLILVAVERISDSCGFVVPKLELAGPPRPDSDGGVATTSTVLDGDQRAWIRQQHLFFTASAPADPATRINVSPKGAMESLDVPGCGTRLRYVDFFGSGIETVAHLKADGRIVVFFCGGTDQRLLSLTCRGWVSLPDEPGYPELLARFSLPDHMRTSQRSILDLEIEQVRDEHAPLPHLRHAVERDQLFRTAAMQTKKHGPGAVRSYIDVNNRRSIDGLEGVSSSDRPATPEERAAFAHEGRKL